MTEPTNNATGSASSPTAPATGGSNGPAPDGLHWTPTQQRMLTVLADGLPHTREELHACLWDGLSQLSAIQRHISVMRGKLRPTGHDIICIEGAGPSKYRLVRMLASPYDGYK